MKKILAALVLGGVTRHPPAGAALASVNAGLDHLILTATESGRQHLANPWQYLLPPPTTPPELPITADLLFA